MSAQQPGLAGPDALSAVLAVHEVIEIVRQWVEREASLLPGFAGAYLWGGITALPQDAPFPLYRDVDVALVMSEGARDENLEVLYRGVMLEVNLQALDEHRDPEAVLADPSRGPNMATTQILADPTGRLVPLQQAVAADYHRRHWVRARCEAEKRSVEKHLAALRQAATPAERLDAVWLLLNDLSGLLAVAQLKRPTTRRTLTLLADLLREQGRSDLHEEALALFGSDRMSREAVQASLDQSAIVFDRSVEVYQTPTPYGFTIRPHLRPYLTGATQEMIDEGNHREAMFWLVALASESYLVLQIDALDEEKPLFAAQQRALYETLGYGSDEGWSERVATAERLAEALVGMADAVAALQPE